VSALIIGLFGGSLIQLYFSLVGDLFRIYYSSANNGILYTGKTIAGIFGGVVFSLFLEKGDIIKWNIPINIINISVNIAINFISLS
jgi:OFA family oxalate/formate antiporter-like MFS transporter